MKVFVKNDTLLTQPKNWSASLFSNQLKIYGFSVSLPVIEPNTVIIFGDYKLMPVEEIRPSIDSATEEFTEPLAEIFSNKVVFTYGKQNKIIEPLPEPLINEPYTGTNGTYFNETQVIERKKYENQYLVVTKQIMQLAGMTVGENEWPKLEDVDYQSVGLQACINNPAIGGFLVTTLAYLHRTLKTDFEWAWANVEFRPEVL